MPLLQTSANRGDVVGDDGYRLMSRPGTLNNGAAMHYGLGLRTAAIGVTRRSVMAEGATASAPSSSTIRMTI